MKTNRPLLICYVAIVLTVLVIFMGGWTRIMDAGLGCPDWPGCFGQLTAPISQQHIDAAQDNFVGVEVDAVKGWIEMVHRYMATTLGLLVMLLVVMAWRRRRQVGYPVRLSFILLLLVVLQGVFGMWTVTLKLLPPIVLGHLLGGLLTLTLLIVLAGKIRAMSNTGHRSSHRSSHRGLMRVAVLILFVQILLGGWTSANYAGWACTHWFSCIAGQSTELDFATGFSFNLEADQNHQGGTLSQSARAAIQMVHRAGAVVVSIVILLVGILALQHRASRRPASLLLALLIAQLWLGGANVIYGIPTLLAWLHHVGAVSLLLCLLWLKSCYREEIRYE
ncbi:COX15/CtaA family protein [Amphritea sp. 1_MG-2023]|uniref:COX15/CtaA family protein n=1 Tax=Amphritea sp. 1_MG-2023 TaxID=3062670 RepID=UPI0026E1F0E8|nr:COX15/CtaA family protein [Amphritea sp. 1_MG-2023]MDO6563864.1 COX15/CtaA family protein [Amphritea sp. 1_MG-2023]